MRIQVLLSMGKYRLSEEDATELLNQRFHVLTSTQELCNSTRNFVNLAGVLPGIGKSYVSFDGVVAALH